MEPTILITFFLATLFVLHAILDLRSKISTLKFQLEDAHRSLSQTTIESETDIACLAERVDGLEQKMEASQEFVGLQLFKIEDALASLAKPPETPEALSALEERLECLNGILFRHLEKFGANCNRVDRELGVAADNFRKISNDMQAQERTLEAHRCALSSLRDAQANSNQTWSKMTDDLSSEQEKIKLIESRLQTLDQAKNADREDIATMKKIITKTQMNQEIDHVDLVEIKDRLDETIEKGNRNFGKATDYFAKMDKQIQEVKDKVYAYHSATTEELNKKTATLELGLGEVADELGRLASNLAREIADRNLARDVTANQVLKLEKQIVGYQQADRAFEEKLDGLIAAMTTGQQVSLGAVHSMQKEVSSLKKDLEDLAHKAVEEKLSPQVMDLLRRIQAIRV